MLDTSGWKKGTVVDYVDRETLKQRVVDTAGRELFWIVAVSESGRESKAFYNIRDLGLRPYWPRLHRKVPGGRGRSREVEVSMFPRRMFVPIPLTTDAWVTVLHAPGVLDLMTFSGGKPAVLTEFAIDVVREMEAKKDAKYRRELVNTKENPYWRGRRVWVEMLLRKMLGTIDELDGRGRIEVELTEEVLGRKIWPFEQHQIQFVET